MTKWMSTDSNLTSECSLFAGQNAVQRYSAEFVGTLGLHGLDFFVWTIVSWGIWAASTDNDDGW